MAASLFSFKKNPSIKTSPLIDPTKFGGAFFGGKRSLSRSEASEKTIANKEIKELSYIKRALETLVSLEKRHFEILTDSIKAFVLSEEKRQSRDEENLQEKKSDKTKKDEKNPLVKQGKKTLEGIGNFFQGLIKTFIAYKVLEWASKKENVKKIQDFVNLFANIFKFLDAIVGFGIDKLFSGLSKLVGGEGVTRVFGFLEAAVGFFTLKWLLNPTKIISDIKMIGNLFTKVIPNAINGVINFFTNLIPKAAGEAADEAISQSGKQISEGATSVAKGAATGAEAISTGVEAAKTGEKVDSTAGKAAGTAAKGAGAAAAKGGAKVTGKSLLKALPVIGAVSSTFFAADRASKGDWLGAGGEILSGVAGLLPGWGTAASLGIDAALIGRDIAKEQGVPMLAKGGIVTKPTEAIVGEAGPEAILPLDKLGSFGIDGFKASTNKMIPKFMKLLTVPFSIVGAGIIALISSVVSKIPGIGQFILPLISNIASSFGLPAGLVAGMSNFVGGVTSAISGGLGNIAELFGKNEVNIRQQKGEEFSPTNDTSVKGLLGNILGALISKQKKVAPASETTPPSTTPAPSGAPSGAPSSGTSVLGGTPSTSTPAPSGTPPSGTPESTPPATKPSSIFTYPTQGEGGVPGQGTGDKIPALLEPQEYVLNRNAVRGLGGPAVLDKINFGMFPRFQAGGSILDKLGDSSKLASAPRGYCVTGVLNTMAKNNVPNPAGTSNDPNNPRGLASQLIKSYGWGSIPNLGSPINLKSPYGNVGANAMTFSEWKAAVKSNKIASGSIIFTTRNSDWSGNQSSGHDAAIAKQGGRKLWSGHWQSQVDGVGAVYGTASNKIIALTPGGKEVPYDGSRTSDDGESKDGENSSTAPAFTAEMGTKAAEQLGKLFQMLTGPATTAVPEVAPAAQPPKITTTVSQNSGNLQRVQRENLKVQAQAKQQTKGGGNVITLGEPNKTITESRSQPMATLLGGTTPPNSLINYPLAP